MTTTPTPTSTPPKMRRGASGYSDFVLATYDSWVVSFNMTYAWRAPAQTVLLPLFESAFSSSRRHLDIGVATGYFPSVALARKLKKEDQYQTQTQNEVQEITLMDLNPGALRVAQARILRDNAEAAAAGRVVVNTVVGDALGPVPAGLLSPPSPSSSHDEEEEETKKTKKNKKFESISMFNLIHCLPTPTRDKTKLFRLAAEVLDEDRGVLVGDTVLGYRYMGWWNPVAWWQLVAFNLIGIFSNWYDEPAVLEEGLRREFDEVETWVVGSTFMFRARKPKQQQQPPPRRGD